MGTEHDNSRLFLVSHAKPWRWPLQPPCPPPKTSLVKPTRVRPRENCRMPTPPLRHDEPNVCLTSLFYKCIMGGNNNREKKHRWEILDNSCSLCSFGPICRANTDFEASKQATASHIHGWELDVPVCGPSQMCHHNTTNPAFVTVDIRATQSCFHWPCLLQTGTSRLSTKP